MSRREVTRMMEDAGFWLKRDGAHLIWTNGEKTITTSASPSCGRALKNIRGDIRRATKGSNMHVERKIIRGESIGDALKMATTPAPKIPTKPEANHMLLGWANEGLQPEVMAEKLKATGYVSEITGRPLLDSAVSFRLNGLGYSRRKANGKPKKAKPREKLYTHVEKPVVQHNDRMAAVKALLNTTSIQADERIAMALLVMG